MNPDGNRGGFFAASMRFKSIEQLETAEHHISHLKCLLSIEPESDPTTPGKAKSPCIDHEYAESTRFYAIVCSRCGHLAEHPSEFWVNQ